MATKPTPSWRDVLKIHPAAELFPRMTEDELRELGKDIKKNGLKSPIALWSPGHIGDGAKPRQRYVLDGINRLDAMERAGLSVIDRDGEPLESHASFKQLFEKRFVTSYAIGARGDGKSSGVKPDTDPYEYVVSANIHRRHLTAEQKRDLIAKLLKADPTKSNRQVAKMVGASHPHVAKVREQAEKAGDVETVTTSVDTKGRKQPARKTRQRTERTPPPAKPETVTVAKAVQPNREDIGPASNGEVLRGEPSHPSLDVIDNMKRIDPEHGPAKALALLAGVPYGDAMDATRETAARLIDEALNPNRPPARDDIGPDSSGELERLRTRNEELENKVRCLEIENLALRSEVDELKADLAKRPPFAPADGLDIPDYLDRTRGGAS